MFQKKGTKDPGGNSHDHVFGKLLNYTHYIQFENKFATLKCLKNFNYIVSNCPKVRPVLLILLFNMGTSGKHVRVMYTSLNPTFI